MARKSASSADKLLITDLTPARRLLLAALVCAGAAWLAGPPARLPLVLALLGLAPGYLLERSLPRPRAHPLARFALWVGGSLSLVALLYQWLWPLGLSLSDPLHALLAIALACGAVGAAWVDLGRQSTTDDRRPTTDDRLSAIGYRLSAIAFWLLLALIIGLTFWTRFEQSKALALPPWVDSVHHALLIRIAAETGRPPSSLEPYMPVENLPYHWGYHVFVASALRLSGLGLAEAMLWSGQILNALHAPLAGALALVLWRRPSAAIGAALVAGLISLMPAYYLSWGRYTQLTGLLLLPGLALAWARGLDGGRAAWPHWAMGAVLLAGLSLIHVRVLAFALALVAAQSLVWAVAQPWPAVRERVLCAVAAAVGAALLSAPWLLMLVRRALLPAVARPGSLVLEGGYDALNLAILWVGFNRWLAALALLALLWGLWRRAPAAATLPLWIGGLLLLANPRLLGYLVPLCGVALLLRSLPARAPAGILAGLGCLLLAPLLLQLPSTWLINNDAVVISLFLPFSAAIGGGAASLYSAAARSPAPALRRASGPLASTLVVALALWGAWQLRSVVNENTVLATPADRAAVEWVAANTSPNARFLINAAPWLGAASRATDGGWWLLPLAGRWVSTPLVLFTYGPPDYVQASIARSELVATYKPGDEQAILAMLRRDGIGYLYFGAKPGPMRPEAFAALPGFTTLYSKDGVTILAVGS